LESQNLQEFTLELERAVPVVQLDRLEQQSGNRTIVKLRAKDSCCHRRWNPHLQTKVCLANIKRRRRLTLGKLFRHVSKRNLVNLDLLKVHLDDMVAKDEQLLRGEKGSPVKCMAVHSRSLEGECHPRVGDMLSHDECHMSPTCVKETLCPLGLVGRVPIAVIGDMQNRAIIDDLLNDSEIGRHAIAPALDPQFKKTDAASDFVIAAMSDIFVGTRVSSMAVMIGVTRVVLGADPQSDHVCVKQRPSNSTHRQFEVCGECVFFCNGTESTLCGQSETHA
jgi:hypothetical protein